MIEQLAIIVKTEDGKFRQVALTKEQSRVVTHLLPSLYEDGKVKVLPNDLALTLEPYKS